MDTGIEGPGSAMESGNQAWLFQFKDDAENKSWLSSAKNGRVSEWVASRYGKEMHAGDLVFFWQSGDRGGLTGWGEIKSGEVKRSPDGESGIDVIEHHWLDTTVSRREVFASNAISPDNTLRKMAIGTNFRLSSDEALSLANLMPPAERSEVLRKLRQGSQAVDVLLSRLGGSSASFEAAWVLRRAASFRVDERGRGELTSTRLLLALVDMGAGRDHDAGSGIDAAIALSRTLASETSFGKQFIEFRSNYERDNPTVTRAPLSAIEPTSNTSDVIRDAIRLQAGPLTGNALVAALLARQRTNASSRLADTGIGMGALLDAVLAILDPSSGAQPWLARARSVWPEIAPAPAPRPIPAEPLKISIAGLGNDDPWQQSLDDKLGVADEARAFARVAAAKNFEPPLAFGIFGDWGSGKSFFMRLIYDHIEKLKAGKAPEANSEQFHQGIVQIRFNAWHYIEQNLWASLVDHIFSDLDRWIRSRTQPAAPDPVFDKLATARELTIDAAEGLVRCRREQQIATERLRDAEQAFEAANAKASGTPRVIWDAVKVAFEKKVSKSELEKTAEILGIDRVANDAEALKKATDALQNEGQRAKLVAQGLLHQLRNPYVLASFLATIFVVPYLLLVVYDAVHSNSGTPIKEFLIAVGGLLSAAAASISYGTTFVTRATNQLEEYGKILDQAIAEQLKNPTEAVKQAKDGLAKSAAAIDEARAMLSASNERLAEATREYAAGTGRGRLLRFVRERASDGQYAKHLGLVATVRKDFAELSALMRDDPQAQENADKQREGYSKRVEALIARAQADKFLTENEISKLEESTKPAQLPASAEFQRIVLYIDDLDRCPPDKVVDVLQAVHLLLTFPLFVVVVAVDHRWVSRALKKQYASLIDAADAPRDGTGSSATAMDYLEKIFQVPYWMRPMDDAASREFLNFRAKEARSEISDPGRLPRLVTMPVGGTDGQSPQPPVGPSGTDTDTDTVHARQKTKITGTSPPEHLPMTQPREFVASALSLTPAEREFISMLAPHVGSTPRRALRFLNVYRVVKASLDPEAIANLEAKGGYRALMCQLAIATGSPGILASWTDALSGFGDQDDLAGVRARLGDEEWFSTLPKTSLLAGTLSAYWAAASTQSSNGSSKGETPEVVQAMLKDGVATLRHYAPLARRYSFVG